jgi:hypothetical protein
MNYLLIIVFVWAPLDAKFVRQYPDREACYTAARALDGHGGRRASDATPVCIPLDARARATWLPDKQP